MMVVIDKSDWFEQSFPCCVNWFPLSKCSQGFFVVSALGVSAQDDEDTPIVEEDIGKSRDGSKTDDEVVSRSASFPAFYSTCLVLLDFSCGMTRCLRGSAWRGPHKVAICTMNACMVHIYNINGTSNTAVYIVNAMAIYIFMMHTMVNFASFSFMAVSCIFISSIRSRK